MAARKRGSAAIQLVSAESWLKEHDVEARRLFTVGPDDPEWIDGGVGEFREGDLVRLLPPAGLSPERVAEVRAGFEKLGCHVIVGAQAAQLESLPQAIRERPRVGSHREVVLALCQEGRSKRKPELRQLLEEIMGEEDV